MKDDPGGEKFVNFFEPVQREAAKHDSVFFLDYGEGNEATIMTVMNKVSAR